MYDKEDPLHIPFHRRLFSEYDADITLPNYIKYFELKSIAKRIESIVTKLSAYHNSALQRYAGPSYPPWTFPFPERRGSLEGPPTRSLTGLEESSRTGILRMGLLRGVEPSTRARRCSSPSSLHVPPIAGVDGGTRGTPVRLASLDAGNLSMHPQASNGSSPLSASAISSPLPFPPPPLPLPSVGPPPSTPTPAGTPAMEEAPGGLHRHQRTTTTPPPPRGSAVGSGSSGEPSPYSTPVYSPLSAHSLSYKTTTVVSTTIEEDDEEVEVVGMIKKEDKEAPLPHSTSGGGKGFHRGGGGGSSGGGSTERKGRFSATDTSTDCCPRHKTTHADPSLSRPSKSKSRSTSKSANSASSRKDEQEKETTEEEANTHIVTEAGTMEKRKEAQDQEVEKEEEVEDDAPVEKRETRITSPTGRQNRMEMLSKERDRLQDEFFRLLEESYLFSISYFHNMETEAGEEIDRMHKLSEKDILAHEYPDYLERLYLRLQKIEKYRSLNLMALQRLCQKFLNRCAQDSLSLQAKVGKWFKTIENSLFVNPNMDLRGCLLELITVYGIVHGMNYKEAIAQLRMYEARQSTSAARVLGPSESSFLNTFLPMQNPKQYFAIRILAGSASVRLEKALSGVLRCRRFALHSACSTIASNGEVDVDLSKCVRGDDVYVIQSTVHTPEKHLSMNGTLMELALLLQTVRLAGARRVTAVVPYMGYTRDTVSISAIAEVLEAMGCHHLITLDLDSEQVEGCFSIPMEVVSAKMEFVRFIIRQLTAEGNDFSRLTIVAPRDLYLRRAKEFADAIMREGHLHPETQLVSVSTAVRRQPVQRDGKQIKNRKKGGEDCKKQEVCSTDNSLATPPPAPTAAPSIHPSQHTPMLPPSKDHLHPCHPFFPDAADPREKSTEQSPSSSLGEDSSIPYRNRTAPPSRRTNSFLFHSSDSERASPEPEGTEGFGAETRRTAEVDVVSPSPGHLGQRSSLLTDTSQPPQPYSHHHPPPPLLHGNNEGTPLLSKPVDRAPLYASYPPDISASPLFKGGVVDPSGMEYALSVQKQGPRAIICSKRQNLFEEESESEAFSEEKYHLVGDVKGRLCIIVDTMIDEALDVAAVSRALMKNGADRVLAVATHPIFSGKAVERLKNAPVDLVVVSDSINQDEVMRDPLMAKKMRIVPIAPLLALAIEKIHTESKLSMFL